MHYLRKMVVLTLGLVALMGLATSTAFAQDPDNGKVLWEETVWQCSACHGQNGEGIWGRPLAGADITADEVIAQVRSPRNRMPTFSTEQVTDEQLIDMHAYITSLPEPEEFGFQDPGLADDAHPGQVLIVEKGCVACHSITGPVRNFENRGDTPTVEGVIAQLRSPAQNMPMFSEDQVTDEEAAQITDFIASQLSPEALPVSGGVNTSNAMLLLVLVGGLLLGAGILIRRFTVARS